jgi:hypothetical protein
MEIKSKYILIAVIVFIVLFSFVFVYQQKMIANLKSEVTGINIAVKNNPQDIAPEFMVRAVQNSISDSTKEIRGSAISKTDNSLVVEAIVVDFSKLSGLKESDLKQTDSLPKTKKTFSIKTDANTQFSEVKLKDIRVGDQVIVFTNEPIFSTNTLTAAKILITSASIEKNPSNLDLADYIKQDHAIAGPIKEVGDNFFTIEANWIDYSKIDYSQAQKIGNMDPASVPKKTIQYKIFVDDKTFFPSSKFSDLKVGDMVEASSNSPTFSVTQFTATEIKGPLQTPGS